MTLNILIIAGAVLLGGIVSQVVFRRLKFIDLEKAKEKSDKMIAKSKEEAEKISKDAEENARNVKKATEDMLKQMKTLINTIEKNLRFKEEIFAKKKNKNKQYQAFIQQVEEEISTSGLKQQEREGLIKQRLASRLGVTIKEITDKLVSQFERELKEETAEQTKKIIDHAKDKAEKIAKNIIRGALQKFTDRTSV